MRIVGGDWKGRPIEAPEGRDTRPTTDRVRESLASMVLSCFDLDLTGLSMLDAFAGSGALGLELLSRGAERCCFVDSDARALACIKKNVASFGLGRERSSVMRGQIHKLIERKSLLGTPFDLVLLDPPYAMDAAEVASCLELMAVSGMLSSGCIVLYERSSDSEQLPLANSELLRTRDFGTTSVELYRMGDSDGR